MERWSVGVMERCRFAICYLSLPRCGPGRARLQKLTGCLRICGLPVSRCECDAAWPSRGLGVNEAVEQGSDAAGGRRSFAIVAWPPGRAGQKPALVSLQSATAQRPPGFWLLYPDSFSDHRLPLTAYRLLESHSPTQCRSVDGCIPKLG